MNANWSMLVEGFRAADSKSTVAQVGELGSNVLTGTAADGDGHMQFVPVVTHAAGQHQVACRRQRAHRLFHRDWFLKEKRCAAGAEVMFVGGLADQDKGH